MFLVLSIQPMLLLDLLRILLLFFKISGFLALPFFLTLTLTMTKDVTVKTKHQTTHKYKVDVLRRTDTNVLTVTSDKKVTLRDVIDFSRHGSLRKLVNVVYSFRSLFQTLEKNIARVITHVW
eukprot:TCONS_00040785-protein